MKVWEVSWNRAYRASYLMSSLVDKRLFATKDAATEFEFELRAAYGLVWKNMDEKDMQEFLAVKEIEVIHG